MTIDLRLQAFVIPDSRLSRISADASSLTAHPPGACSVLRLQSLLGRIASPPSPPRGCAISARPCTAGFPLPLSRQIGQATSKRSCGGGPASLRASCLGDLGGGSKRPRRGCSPATPRTRCPSSLRGATRPTTVSACGSGTDRSSLNRFRAGCRPRLRPRPANYTASVDWSRSGSSLVARSSASSATTPAPCTPRWARRLRRSWPE